MSNDNKEPYTNRRLIVKESRYTEGPKGIVFQDADTLEEFRIYADELLKMLKGQTFEVTAKVINANKSYKGLRIQEKF